MADHSGRTVVTTLLLTMLRVAWSALGAVAGIAAFVAATNVFDLSWIEAWHFPEIAGVTLAASFVPWLGSAALGALAFTRFWTVVQSRMKRRAPSVSTVA